ncbi:MAG: hypothetical protein ACE5F9_13225, partial [Phycisphaerae bacterium]
MRKRKTRRRLSRRRLRWIFRILAVMLPLLAVAAAESICRYWGFGGYPPVILDVGAEGSQHWYSTHRPGVDSFFYTQLSHTGGMREVHFTTPKPPHTVRILLLGGSAMQGYPQPLPLTNGAFLKAMLDDVWDDTRRAEVLNLGATAMASFPAMVFLDEMLPHELDLVIVMSGNNEFYGAYGVSSLHTAGKSPAGMRFMRWARRLGLKQWLDSKRLKVPHDEKFLKQTLMERVVVTQRIDPDDPLREAAETCLRTHLTRMVQRCVASRVPVIVCTLPTNERSMAPIGADPDTPLTEQDERTFQSLMARAKDATGPEQTADVLRKALRLRPEHARAHFLLGQALTALGRHKEAHNEYIAARDLDTMPWRSPTAADRAVRAAAAKGATLCDIAAAFRDVSPGGAIGWELMSDHVHMSLRGQTLFARTLVRTLTRLTGRLHVDPAAVERLPDWHTYTACLGAGPQSDYVADSRVNTLFNIPFMKRSNPQAHERFLHRCNNLLNAMSPLDREAVTRWRDPGLHVSRHRPLSFVIGYYRMTHGDYAGAAPLFEFARNSLPRMSLWRLQLSWYILKCHRMMHAEPTKDDRHLCREAIRIGRLLNQFVGFRDPSGPTYLGLVYNLVGNHDAAVTCLDSAVRYAKGPEAF